MLGNLWRCYQIWQILSGISQNRIDQTRHFVPTASSHGILPHQPIRIVQCHGDRSTEVLGSAVSEQIAGPSSVTLALYIGSQIAPRDQRP